MSYLETQLELLRRLPSPSEPERLSHRQLQVAVEGLVYRWVVDRDPELVEAAVRLLAALRAQQGSDGLFLTGDNLLSPPDTAFTVNGLCRLLRVLEVVHEEDLEPVRRSASEIVTACLDALVAGGVHTPNHRWELSCALVQLWHLFGTTACLERARQWLAEGIDLQPDGLFSERSPNYGAHVSGPCLLEMATLLDRQDLADMVHTHLHATVALVDDRDRIETIQSRRQDQHTGFSLTQYGLLYRRLAQALQCPTCAAMAARAEAGPQTPDVDAVAQCLLDPRLDGPLPEGRVAGDTGGWHLFETSQLAVWTQDGLRVVTHAASDVHTLGRLASGLSADPTFAKVGLDRLGIGMRLSRSFFNLGPFRATELRAERDLVLLEEQVHASYYQPLPPELRRPDGRYALEFEGRFAAQMGFSGRDESRVSLSTRISVLPRPRGVDVEVVIDGAPASHVLELALTEGLGAVTGQAGLRDPHTAVVVGEATVADGRVLLQVDGAAGPDVAAVDYNPGEAYTFLRGSDAVQGDRVLVPLRSPGRLMLRLLFASAAPQA